LLNKDQNQNQPETPLLKRTIPPLRPHSQYAMDQMESRELTAEKLSFKNCAQETNNQNCKKVKNQTAEPCHSAQHTQEWPQVPNAIKLDT